MLGKDGWVWSHFSSRMYSGMDERSRWLSSLSDESHVVWCLYIKRTYDCSISCPVMRTRNQSLYLTENNEPVNSSVCIFCSNRISSLSHWQRLAYVGESKREKNGQIGNNNACTNWVMRGVVWSLEPLLLRSSCDHYYRLSTRNFAFTDIAFSYCQELLEWVSQRPAEIWITVSLSLPATSRDLIPSP